MRGRARTWFVVAASIMAPMGASACAAPENAQPLCHNDPPTVLMAESVPTATLIPCVRGVPGGWSFQSFEANDTVATFTMEQQEGGVFTIEFRGSCQPEGERVPEPEPAVQAYRSVQDGGTRTVWTSTFTGGCSRAELTFPAAPPTSDVEDVRAALSFISRDELHPA
jgi:hypothetical protein